MEHGTNNVLYIFSPRKVKVRANALKNNYRVTRGSPIVLDSCLQTSFAKYATGCLKKSEFYHIEHLQVGFPLFFGQHVSKTVILVISY